MSNNEVLEQLIKEFGEHKVITYCEMHAFESEIIYQEALKNQGNEPIGWNAEFVFDADRMLDLSYDAYFWKEQYEKLSNPNFENLLKHLEP